MDVSLSIYNLGIELYAVIAKKCSDTNGKYI